MISIVTKYATYQNTSHKSNIFMIFYKYFKNLKSKLFQIKSKNTFATLFRMR